MCNYACVCLCVLLEEGEGAVCRVHTSASYAHLWYHWCTVCQLLSDVYTLVCLGTCGWTAHVQCLRVRASLTVTAVLACMQHCAKLNHV